MPIYEYRCNDCGEISEFIVFGDNDNLSCRSCNSQNIERILSAHNTHPDRGSVQDAPMGCCGSPNSCGSPGSCCSG
ncbi:MAG: zinc ribbon domain-containing protein [Syntrophorhabdales bacterium]|nr:zinc ribbon domain-containing protein [Syntrophorhabdales bacterium]